MVRSWTKFLSQPVNFPSAPILNQPLTWMVWYLFRGKQNKQQTKRPKTFKGPCSPKKQCALRWFWHGRKAIKSPFNNLWAKAWCVSTTRWNVRKHQWKWHPIEIVHWTMEVWKQKQERAKSIGWTWAFNSC